MEIDARSRYQFSKLYKDSKGRLYWGTREKVSFPPSDGDQYHKVLEAEARRIDLIAYKYYEDCALWWVIAEANDITCPLELKAGRVLRIPDIETVYRKGLG